MVSEKTQIYKYCSIGTWVPKIKYHISVFQSILRSPLPIYETFTPRFTDRHLHILTCITLTPPTYDTFTPGFMDSRAALRALR